MGITKSHILELIKFTTKDLPLSNYYYSYFMHYRKQLYEIWGCPVLSLIKEGKKIPIDLKIYWSIPTKWILEWRKRYGNTGRKNTGKVGRA